MQLFPRSLAIPFALAAASGARAQDIVVPPTCATADGAAGGAMAGFSARFRMQVLLESSTLIGLVGREITALVFRRDGQDLRAMTGGQSSLVVRLSTRAPTPAAADATFANNEGSDVAEVFRGVVTLPDAPALSNRNGAGWLREHTVRIPLASTFHYQSGTLCIDIEGTPVTGAASPWWRIDYDWSSHDGRTTTLGQACDSRSHAFASANTLLPSGSVRLTSSGPIGSVGIALLGASQLPSPLPLGFLGAPTCTLDIVPILNLGTSYGPPASQGYGIAGFELQLPASPSLAGGVLFAQWAAFPAAQNPQSLSTTNALELRVATLLPPPSRSVTVRTGPLAASASVPMAGRVLPHMAPVVCFQSR